MCAEASFGEELGGLLASQAQCEEMFERTNCIDAVHMEPLDSEIFETVHQRHDAIRNAQQIKVNILKLVRKFRRDDLLAKLMKEYRDIINRPQQNEIASFKREFDKTKSLWTTKLATSQEDSKRMDEQLFDFG